MLDFELFKEKIMDDVIKYSKKNYKLSVIILYSSCALLASSVLIHIYIKYYSDIRNYGNYPEIDSELYIIDLLMLLMTLYSLMEFRLTKMAKSFRVLDRNQTSTETTIDTEL